jgi:Arc/MetJ-type ribon-helix-helix transcriptional regulator
VLIQGKEMGIYAGSKVTQILKQSIEKAVKTGRYLTESDFIRDAIKEKLEVEGFLLTNANEKPKGDTR